MPDGGGARRLGRAATSCYKVTMRSPLSLVAGAGQRLALVAPLLAALWALVLWAMA
jgi:hypothetical protein